MGKYKKVFVSPASGKNRIELDPATVVSEQPLPPYTYGTASNETFPQTFPTVRKEGVGVAADASTPTFGGSEGEGKEIDFFATKKKIDNIIHKSGESMEFIEKSKIYFDPKKGESAPKGVQVYRGKKGGYFYYGTLPGSRKKESAKVEAEKNEWEPARGRTRSVGGSPVPPSFIPDTVYLNRDKGARLQVAGVDEKGMFRYIPLLQKKSPDTISAALKVERMKIFRKELPNMVKQMDRDINTKQEAMILKVQYLTGFRIGAEEDTKGDIPSFGISTMRRDHVKVLDNNRVKISFVGKSKGTEKVNTRIITEPNFVKWVSRIKNPNAPVFSNYSYRGTRNYLWSLSEEKFKTHDFRTFRGTEKAVEVMKKMPKPTNQKEFDKAKMAVCQQVSDYLFNSRSVAEQHYITTDTWNRWKAKGINVHKVGVRKGEALGDDDAFKLLDAYQDTHDNYVLPDVWTPWEAGIMGGDRTDKYHPFNAPVFNDMDDMLNRVQYIPASEGSEQVRKEIDGLLEKTKIYLGQGRNPPPGVRVQIGDEGGRFYESSEKYYERPLEIYEHLKQRIKERNIAEKEINQAITILDRKGLPDRKWFLRLANGSFLVGEANKVQSVLSRDMVPAGTEIKV